MRRTVLPYLSLLFITLPLFGQRPPIEIGIQHVIALGSETSFAGGRLEIPASRGFAATGEIFWSERWSTQFAATFINPEAILYLPNDVDLGTLGIDIYSAQARVHFRPAARFDPYAGAGVAAVVLGNLEERFGDDIETDFDSELTFNATAGVRWKRNRLALDAGATYTALEPELRVIRTDVALPARLDLYPIVIHFGATWRF
jgi:hypothetical protein